MVEKPFFICLFSNGYCSLINKIVIFGIVFYLHYNLHCIYLINNFNLIIKLLFDLLFECP